MSIHAAQNNNAVCNCVCHKYYGVSVCNCNCNMFKQKDIGHSQLGNSEYEKIEIKKSGLETKIQELEAQVNTLIDLYKQLTIHYDLEKLEKLILEGAKTHASILRCEATIKRLETYVENHAAIIHELERDQTLINKIMALTNEVEELKRFQDITHEQYKLTINRKHPYKCPVCEGTRICHNKENGLSWQCEPCEGKGIVW